MRCHHDKNPRRCMTSCDGGFLHCTGMSCKCWDCDDCRPARFAGLKRLAAAGRPTTMITLTIRNTGQEDHDALAQRLVQCWRNILQRAKREGIAAGVEYVAVFEAQRSGMPHLHILCRAPFIPHDWISARMDEYLDSPNVWIRRVFSQQQAASYVAKYISKGPHRYAGCKRYWRSQGYALVDPDSLRDTPLADRAWTVHGVGFLELADLLRSQGWDIHGTRPGGWIGAPPSEDAPGGSSRAWDRAERGFPRYEH